MKQMKQWQTSKYLQVIPRPHDFALYHSLFGNLCLVDQKIVELCEAFNQPQTNSEVTVDQTCYSREYIASFIDIFKTRQFLINPGFDEYGEVHQKLEQRKRLLVDGHFVSVVQLVVTNQCNFCCKYCFTNSIYSSPERAALQSATSNQMMDQKTAKKAIEQVLNLVKNTGRKTLHIQFFGGEPLINWEVIKYVLESFGHGIAGEIEIGYSIVTNGSLITPEMANYFHRYHVPVVVSFDSPHESDRVLTNGKESISAVQNSLALLKEHQNRIVFNSVLAEETFNYFGPDLVDFALNYGVEEIGVLFDLDPEFYQRHSTMDIVDKLWDLYRYANGRAILVTGYWHMIFQQMLNYNYFKDRGYKTCSATGCQFSIEPSGAVFACKGSSGYFGEISKIDELLSSVNYEKYAMRAFRNAPDCAGCMIENFCSGFCLGALEKKYHDISIIEPGTCEVYRELIKRLILDLKQEEVDTFYTTISNE